MSDASPTAEATTASADKNRSLWGDVRYQLMRSPLFWASSVMVLIILTMAFVPQLWASTPPTARGACDLLNAREKPSSEHWFGYTAAGCDMWSSIVYGTGKSVNLALLVAVATVGRALPPGWMAG